MSELSDNFSVSDSGEATPPKIKSYIDSASVLKHLPQARNILEGHSYQKNSTRCVFKEQLNQNSKILMIDDWKKQ